MLYAVTVPPHVCPRTCWTTPRQIASYELVVFITYPLELFGEAHLPYASIGRAIHTPGRARISHLRTRQYSTNTDRLFHFRPAPLYDMISPPDICGRQDRHCHCSNSVAAAQRPLCV